MHHPQSSHSPTESNSIHTSCAGTLIWRPYRRTMVSAAGGEKPESKNLMTPDDGYLIAQLIKSNNGAFKQGRLQQSRGVIRNRSTQLSAAAALGIPHSTLIERMVFEHHAIYYDHSHRRVLSNIYTALKFTAKQADQVFPARVVSGMPTSPPAAFWYRAACVM